MLGSLINEVMARSAPPEPKVGDGATILKWSDRDPATIVEVRNKGKTVIVKCDNYRRTDKNGMSEAQDYTYSPNPDALPDTFTLRKNGRYVRAGEPMNGTGLLIGHRERYYDFSF